MMLSFPEISVSGILPPPRLVATGVATASVTVSVSSMDRVVDSVELFPMVPSLAGEASLGDDLEEVIRLSTWMIWGRGRGGIAGDFRRVLGVHIWEVGVCAKGARKKKGV